MKHKYKIKVLLTLKELRDLGVIKKVEKEKVKDEE
jgi:hypothetical protein